LEDFVDEERNIIQEDPAVESGRRVMLITGGENNNIMVAEGIFKFAPF